jgi:hypothetical protein
MKLIVKIVNILQLFKCMSYFLMEKQNFLLQ